MTKAPQVLFAEDRLLRAGRSFGRARFEQVNNDAMSDRAIGRYLSDAAELVKAAEALWTADEDARTAGIRAGLRELVANAPGMTGVVEVDLSEGGES